MYSWEGMQKIGYEEALQRFRNGEEVYALYNDEAEAMIFEEDRIHEHHRYGGEFGYEL